MPWVESASPSFRARHDAGDGADVERLLDSLESTRDRLSGLFAHADGGFTLVVHRSSTSLTLSNPLIKAVALAAGTSRAARALRRS